MGELDEDTLDERNNGDRAPIVGHGQFEISDAIVTNTGGADSRFTTQLLVDGKVVAEDVLTIASGGQRATIFDHQFEQANTYQVRVNDVITGDVLTLVVDATLPSAKSMMTKRTTQTGSRR